MSKGKVKAKQAKRARRRRRRGGDLSGAALDRVAGRATRDEAILTRMAVVAAAAEAVSAISRAAHADARAIIKSLKP
jgi:hypothetical protein